MSVSETQPVSVGDLDAILPLPISAGGTGAMDAAGACANLGIYDIVEQYVENYYTIKESHWKGSAQTYSRDEYTSGTYPFNISQSEPSANIAMSGSYIHFNNAGTYQFTGTVSGSGKYYSTGGAQCYVNLTNGTRIGSIRISSGTKTSAINANVSISAGASLGLNFVVEDGDYFGSSVDLVVKIQNLAIQRIS